MSYQHPKELFLSDHLVASFDEEDWEIRSLVVKDGESADAKILARVEYVLPSTTGKTLEIYDWSLNWRDTYPLERAIRHLSECLYPTRMGYQIKIMTDDPEFWYYQGFSYLDDNTLILPR